MCCGRRAERLESLAACGRLRGIGVAIDELRVELDGLPTLSNRLKAPGGLVGGLGLPEVKDRRGLLFTESIRHLEEGLDGVFVVALFKQHLALHKAGSGGDLGAAALREGTIGSERLVELAKVLPGPGGGIPGLRSIGRIGLRTGELFRERQALFPVALPGRTLPGTNQREAAKLVRLHFGRIGKRGSEGATCCGIITGLKQ